MRKILSIMCLVCVSTISTANEDTYKAATRLFDSMDFSATMDQMIEETLAVELQNNPDAAPFQEVIKKIL